MLGINLFFVSFWWLLVGLQLICSNHVGAFIHFLQLTGPEIDSSNNIPAGTTANSSSEGVTQQSLKQQLQPQLDFEQSLAGLDDKATFNRFTAGVGVCCGCVWQHTWHVRFVVLASASFSACFICLH